MNCVLRPAATGDLEHLLHLDRATPSAPHWQKEVYERLLADTQATNRAITGVALIDRSVAGFVSGHSLLGEAELESIVVAESHRGKGIGRLLLQWFLQSAGAASVRLEVRPGNVAALALYHGCGFQQIGRRSLYYADPVEDALLLRWQPHSGHVQSRHPHGR